MDELQARGRSRRVQVHGGMRADPAAKVIRECGDIARTRPVLVRLFLIVILAVEESRFYFRDANHNLFDEEDDRNINKLIHPVEILRLPNYEEDLLFHLQHEEIFHGDYSEENSLLKLLR